MIMILIKKILLHNIYKIIGILHTCINFLIFPRTTVSQDVQTRFLVQLAFAKFLSKIKGNF